ncbi:TPA: hypothetical protein ACPSKZ_000710 [Legionella anisa]|uniref:hypothetical protein n=1 Tax=Legionella anisa TaxID=28082 RepID=UPI002244C31D|nr:hypothetical protein [Legionella anisa]MCW8425592.1 hypothetical protein [Legionella anisa]MCW8448978.1 hypothetical protein [Legionella anisa]
MNTHVINGKTIFVNYDSQRAFWGGEPWIAFLDGYDGAPIDNETPSDDPIGKGYTEDEAIQDLIAQGDEDVYA